LTNPERALVFVMNEQEKTDLFERIVGGPQKGFQLMRIYEKACQDHNPRAMFPSPRFDSAEDLFRARAQGRGYTARQIESFLDLQ